MAIDLGFALSRYMNTVSLVRAALSRYMNWRLVRSLAELQILTKASYAMLLIVPILAGTWPGVRLVSCFLIEVIATFFFLYVIIGTTSKGAAVGFAGIPIGLCLTLIHLFLIPVTNASVNPARSTGPALFAGGAYIGRLWLFWLAPILGAALAGVVARWQHDMPD
jgi:glycerol uptake facilitator-like aquaporin